MMTCKLSFLLSLLVLLVATFVQAGPFDKVGMIWYVSKRKNSLNLYILATYFLAFLLTFFFYSLTRTLFGPPIPGSEGTSSEDGSITFTQENIGCMAGGVFNAGGMFTGTYMCREESHWIFWKRNRTKCVPTVTNAVIAEPEDRCGCCGGQCPKACTCVCDAEKGHVLVRHQTGLFAENNEDICISRGKASRYIADETRLMECVSDEECPAITAAPTAAPAAFN